MQSTAENTLTLRWVYCCVFLGSLLVAVWTGYIDPVINPDGVKYVLAADAFLRQQYGLAFDAYKWPGYSISIAMVSKLTSLSSEQSAHLFNAVMRGMAGIAFVRLTCLFGGNAKQLWLAAGIYLCYPGLNEVQSMIIRDFAYLGCFLWMVVFFLEQTWNPTRFNLFAFIFMGVLATLYRIEGLVFVFGLVVFYLMSGTVSQKFRRGGLLLICFALPVLVYGLLMWIYDGELGNAWGVLVTMFERLREDLDIYITDLHSGWLKSVFNTLFYGILGVMPFGKLAVNIVEIVSVGYFLVLLWGLFHQPCIPDVSTKIVLLKKGWRWVVGINLVVLIGFVFIKQIVTDRYPLSLSLMLIVYLPFIITEILNKARQTSPGKHTAFAGILIFLIFINTVEGLDRFSSKGHLKEAGTWVREQMPENYARSEVYSNDRVVDYYAGKKEVEHDRYYSLRTVIGLTQSNRWKILDFMTISLKPDSPPGFYRNFRYRIGKEPDKIFENSKGAKVLVYDFRPEEKKNY